MCTGYEAYAGYYAPDGTAYSYDPNAYAAAATAPAEAAVTAETDAAVAGPAEQTVVGQTVAGPVAAEVAVSQGQIAAESYGLEPIVGLLTSDEKSHLEQQQEEADTARKEAEERLREAEERRQNAKVRTRLYLCI